MWSLFPEIEPHDAGMLDVGDGNRIHWNVSGNPDGHPVVALHGGPGSGSSPSMRRFFDPAMCRIVLFDQRGCGRSTPHASDPATDMSVNTTAHLLADIERLRDHLAVERWLVFGHSWGSTLGLAYAEQHPERVATMVLAGVTMTRRAEIDWLYRGLAPLYPAQWERFRLGVPEARRDGDLVAAYHDLLDDPDPAVREKAAVDWHDWESAPISIDPDAAPPASWADPRFRLARARICTHYFAHNGWLEEGVLLRNAHRLAGIPGAMIQGRLDLEAPLVTAWELDRAWPDGELLVVNNAGHSNDDPGMSETIVAAVDCLLRRVF